MNQRGNRRARLHRRLADRLQGFLLFAGIIVSPWAFGTVHDSSIAVLNGIGFSIGTISAIQLFFFRGSSADSDGRSRRGSDPSSDFLIPWILLLSSLFLVYVLLSWMNFRAEFSESSLSFSFREDYIPWLPHTYDREATFQFLLRFISLFCFYWGVRQWLSAGRNIRLKSRHEEPREYPNQEARPTIYNPRRLKALLGVIAVNSGLLAFVGILQRLDGGKKLLWIYEPKMQMMVDQSFGPFAYRGNAASLINLAWPIALLLYFLIRNESAGLGARRRLGSSPAGVVVPLLALLLVAPIATTSRAGLLVFGLEIFLVVAFSRKLLFPLVVKHMRVVVPVALSACLFLVYIAGEFGTWARVLETAREGIIPKYTSRLDIYQHIPEMLENYGLQGSGAGSFPAIYVAHRKPFFRPYVGEFDNNSRLVPWSAWLHCDPAEFVITFGVIGTLFLVVAYVLMLIEARRAFQRAEGLGTYIPFLPIAQGGMIIHSLIDFPFQVYSVSLLFVVTCAIMRYTPTRLYDERDILDVHNTCRSYRYRVDC